MEGFFRSSARCASAEFARHLRRSVLRSDFGEFTQAVQRLVLVAATAGAFVMGAQAAEPFQTPLTSRSGSTPPPNVMITIDDSGSMLSDAMPEQYFTVNGKSVAVIYSYWAAAFPNDPRKGSTYAGCYVPAELASTNVYQMQFRSPDVNTIWYNPDVRYKPWLKPTPAADGSGVRMADVTDLTVAKWDPVTTGLSPATFNLQATQSFRVSWCTGANTYAATSSKNFYPGLVYRLTSGADPTKTSSYVRYNINDAASYAPAVKGSDRTDCAGTRCTQAEERRNFGNWFTYYRMRESMAKAAVTESFFNFKDKLRAGWGRINKTTASAVDGSSNRYQVVEKGVAQLDATQLQSVLSGIQGIQSWPSTPLRTALDSVGAYFKGRTDIYSPWVTTPGATVSPGNAKLSCRRSVNVLTTDGYYNDDYSAAGDLDSRNSSYVYSYDTSHPDQNPGNYSPDHYVAQRPFIDNPRSPVSNSLADAAMRWYVQDLDSTIANNVVPVDGDIAFWQHLTQYTVGIGVKGTLDASTTAAKLATIASITNGTANWPNPTSSDAAKIDDLWHAAVNTGGDFYSVSNVTELTNALANAFGKAVGNEAREAGVATVASTLITGNLKFVPQYKSGAWYGDVLAYTLDDSGNVLNTTPVWKASTALPAFGSRKLYSWNGTAPVEFTTTALDATSKTLISSTTATADALIGYVRGDTTNEGAAATYRARNGELLGDFVNSPPVYVKDLVDMGYGSLSNGTWASSYASYLTSKAARTDGVVMVGGNAGVFHALRGSDGREMLGFVPRTGFPKFASIAAKNYGSDDNYHAYVVDGPTLETDAYIAPRGEAGARWTNMVVGSMGAGGKAVFALNLPTADPTNLSANSVQWELSGHADLGYVQGDIKVGPIQGGTGWYAFVGNGPYSTNGNAVLLVVDLQTGAVAKSISVPTTGANGLGGVYVLRNSNKEVYAAYAGDLQGNLWRFDFTSGADTASWKVGFGGSPLFKARDSAGRAQPFTAAPVVVKHPQQGYMVLAGTGRLIDEADASDTHTQSFYGLWDSTAAGKASAALSPFYAASQTAGPAPYRSVLASQTIDTSNVVVGTDAGVANSERYFKVSSNSVDWNTQLGWYMDLTNASGQRVTYTPQTILNYVYFSTIVPALPAGQCEYNTGTGYNFIVNAVTGAAPTIPVFDVNGDGVVNSSDTVVAGYQSLADGIDKLLTAQSGVVGDQTSVEQCLPDTNKKCGVANACLVVVVNSSNEAEEVCVEGPAKAPPTTKVITDRVWYQILNPPH